MRVLTPHVFLARASTWACAALAGGAWKRGQGCLFFLLASTFGSIANASDNAVVLPSGQGVAFLDMVQDRSAYGLSYHFRFLAPQISAGVGFEDVSADMQSLCDSFAMPRLSNIGPQPAQIVIALLSKPIEFGASAPEITQFFEAYSVQDGACIWEAF